MFTEVVAVSTIRMSFALVVVKEPLARLVADPAPVVEAAASRGDDVAAPEISNTLPPIRPLIDPQVPLTKVTAAAFSR